MVEVPVDTLQASEERFRMLVDSVRGYAIFMLDVAGRVTTWNLGAVRTKGWRADEIIGQPYEVFFTAEDRAAGLPAQLLARAMVEGELEELGWRVRKDGSRFRASALLSAVRSSTGEHCGFAKITRDLTEQLEPAEVTRRYGNEQIRRLQQLIAALSHVASPEAVAQVVLEQSLRALEAHAGVLFLMASDEHTLVLLDQRGYPDGQLDGFEQIDIDAGNPPSEAARTRTPIFHETRETTLRAYPELREIRERAAFEAAAFVPLLTHGKLLGVLALRFPHETRFTPSERAMLLTVSELCAQALDRARLFAAESKARAAAEAANRAKDQFLAMLGHELRNPLAPIVTALELLDQRDEPSSHRELTVIDRQVKYLVRMVDDLLDVSRITQAKVQLRRERVELAEIVRRAIELCAPIVDERRHHLAVDVPAQGLVVFGDVTRLAQVISNLLTNGAKYTPPGGHIAIAAGPVGARAVLTVRDDGVGITRQMLPYVFDLFAQEQQGLDRPVGGLGLGLAIVKSLVAMHDGTIGAASAGLGQGSTFTLELPIASELVPAAVEPRAGPRPVAVVRRVLVVDDNIDAAELLAEILRGDGHEVITAYDGPSALLAAGSFRADIALLDIGLPVMDGYELARRLRGDLGAIRLVALTGYGLAGDRERTRVAGFDVHMVKPVDLAALRTAIVG